MTSLLRIAQKIAVEVVRKSARVETTILACKRFNCVKKNKRKEKKKSLGRLNRREKVRARVRERIYVQNRIRGKSMDDRFNQSADATATISFLNIRTGSWIIVFSFRQDTHTRMPGNKTGDK